MLFRVENSKNEDNFKNPQIKKRTGRSLNTIENKARLCQHILSFAEQNDFLDEKSYNINTARQSEESGVG